MRRVSLLDALLVVMSIAALGVTGALAWRALPSRGEPADTEPLTVTTDRVRAVSSAGWRSGPREPAARLTVVSFSDFQCPACRGAADDLRAVQNGRSGTVAVVYRHYPVEQAHPHAFAAAIAAECAAEQGRFQEFHDVLFKDQDQIGTRPRTEFADMAGVGDLGGFITCIGSDRPAERVRRDIQAARELRLGGTPRLIVGNTIVRGRIGRDSLSRLVERELAR